MLRRLQHVPVPGDVGGDVLLLALGHAVVEARKVNDRVVPLRGGGDGSGIEDVHLVEGDGLPGRRDVEHRDAASREERIDHEAPETPASAGDEYLFEAHAFPCRWDGGSSASMILHRPGVS